MAQCGDQRFSVAGIARFDGEVEIRCFCGHVEKESMMGDVDDVAARFADDRGDPGESARLIGTLETQGYEAMFANELSL